MTRFLHGTIAVLSVALLFELFLLFRLPNRPVALSPAAPAPGAAAAPAPVAAPGAAAAPAPARPILLDRATRPRRNFKAVPAEPRTLSRSCVGDEDPLCGLTRSR